jgi:hypothetical protein
MKKLIIYGAYDRYNYGDNVMPVLFELFINKYYPELTSCYELIFASISSSDLTRYEAKATKSIDLILKESGEDVAAIIVIGGEVLCASSSTLFMHMEHPFGANFTIRAVGKLLPRIADRLAKIFYPVPWEYPYIPDKNKLPKGVKVAFNTIGGDLKSLSNENKYKVLECLGQADFLSVRDSRTAHALGSIDDVKKFPDSVCAVADLIDDSVFERFTRKGLLGDLNDGYICFQAAPHKIGVDVQIVSRELKKIARKFKLKVMLLPIGYAAGHDDYEFLEKVRCIDPEIFSISYGLNIWEIMFLIKSSRIFLGTSLHGCITALSFGVRCVGVNPAIYKLDEFMKNWGVAPFDKSYELESLVDCLGDALSVGEEELIENATKIRSLALKNNMELINSLKLL